MPEAKADLLRLFGPLGGPAPREQRLRALALKVISLGHPPGALFNLAFRRGMFGEVAGSKGVPIEFTPTMICDLVAAGLARIEGRNGRAVVAATKAGREVASALVAAARAKDKGTPGDA